MAKPKLCGVGIVSALYLVLPLALVLVGIGIGAFVWATRKGQFDDMTTPAMRALHEEDPHDRNP